MKKMGKYFLALVPEGKIQQLAQGLKEEIRETFGVKYALKSPAHVTLKMPFVFNEAKEQELISRIHDFLKSHRPFDLQIEGVDTFGNRVIFWGVMGGSSLYELQADLRIFCKQELKLVDELADRNYHPHMTIAFKDLKATQFDRVLKLVQAKGISEPYRAEAVWLLKKIFGRWELCQRIAMNTSEK